MQNDELTFYCYKLTIVSFLTQFFPFHYDDELLHQYLIMLQNLLQM